MVNLPGNTSRASTTTASSANANLTNPLVEDEELQALLKQVADITKEHEFTRWRASFLARFESLLDQDGIETARQADAEVLELNQKFDKTLDLVKQLVDDGVIAPEKGLGVKGTNAVNKLKAGCIDLEKRLMLLVPGTGSEVKACGYNKFQLGAVLVRDGFEVYGHMHKQDILLELLKEQVLEEVVDRQIVDAINYYLRQIQCFCDVMADLGLFGVMVKMREFAGDEFVTTKNQAIDFGSADIVSQRASKYESKPADEENSDGGGETFSRPSLGGGRAAMMSLGQSVRKFNNHGLRRQNSGGSLGETDGRDPMKSSVAVANLRENFSRNQSLTNLCGSNHGGGRQLGGSIKRGHGSSGNLLLESDDDEGSEPKRSSVAVSDLRQNFTRNQSLSDLMGGTGGSGSRSSLFSGAGASRSSLLSGGGSNHERGLKKRNSFGDLDSVVDSDGSPRKSSVAVSNLRQNFTRNQSLSDLMGGGSRSSLVGGGSRSSFVGGGGSRSSLLSGSSCHERGRGLKKRNSFGDIDQMDNDGSPRKSSVAVSNLRQNFTRNRSASNLGGGGRARGGLGGSSHHSKTSLGSNGEPIRSSIDIDKLRQSFNRFESMANLGGGSRASLFGGSGHGGSYHGRPLKVGGSYHDRSHSSAGDFNDDDSDDEFGGERPVREQRKVGKLTIQAPIFNTYDPTRKAQIQVGRLSEDAAPSFGDGTVDREQQQVGKLDRGGPDFDSDTVGELREVGRLSQGGPNFSEFEKGQRDVGALSQGGPNFGDFHKDQQDVGKLSQGAPSFSEFQKGQEDVGKLGPRDAMAKERANVVVGKLSINENNEGPSDPITGSYNLNRGDPSESPLTQKRSPRPAKDADGTSPASSQPVGPGDPSSWPNKSGTNSVSPEEEHKQWEDGEREKLKEEQGKLLAAAPRAKLEEDEARRKIAERQAKKAAKQKPKKQPKQKASSTPNESGTQVRSPSKSSAGDKASPCRQSPSYDDQTSKPSQNALDHPRDDGVEALDVDDASDTPAKTVGKLSIQEGASTVPARPSGTPPKLSTPKEVSKKPSKRDAKKKAVQEAIDDLRKNASDLGKVGDPTVVTFAQLTGLPKPEETTPDKKEDFMKGALGWLRNNSPNIAKLVDGPAKSEPPDRTRKTSPPAIEGPEAKLSGAISWLRQNDPDFSNVNDPTVVAFANLTGLPLPKELTPKKNEEFMGDAMDWLRNNQPDLEKKSLDDATVKAITDVAGTVPPKSPLTKEDQRERLKNSAPSRGTMVGQEKASTDKERREKPSTDMDIPINQGRKEKPSLDMDIPINSGRRGIPSAGIGTPTNEGTDEKPSHNSGRVAEDACSDPGTSEQSGDDPTNELSKKKGLFNLPRFGKRKSTNDGDESENRPFISRRASAPIGLGKSFNDFNAEQLDLSESEDNRPHAADGTEDATEEPGKEDSSKSKKRGMFNFPKFGKRKSAGDMDHGERGPQLREPASEPFGLGLETEDDFVSKSEPPTKGPIPTSGIATAGDNTPADGSPGIEHRSSDPHKKKLPSSSDDPTHTTNSPGKAKPAKGRAQPAANEAKPMEEPQHTPASTAKPFVKSHPSTVGKGGQKPSSRDNSVKEKVATKLNSNPRKSQLNQKGGPDGPTDSNTSPPNKRRAGAQNEEADEKPDCQHDGGKGQESKELDQTGTPQMETPRSQMGSLDEDVTNLERREAPNAPLEDKPRKKGMFQLPKFGKRKSGNDMDDSGKPAMSRRASAPIGLGRRADEEPDPSALEEPSKQKDDASPDNTTAPTNVAIKRAERAAQSFDGDLAPPDSNQPVLDNRGGVEQPQKDGLPTDPKGEEEIEQNKPKKKGIFQFPKFGKGKAGDDIHNSPGNSRLAGPASEPFGATDIGSQEGSATPADEESQPEGTEQALIEGNSAHSAATGQPDGIDAQSDPNKPKKKGLFQFPKFGKGKSGDDIDSSPRNSKLAGPVSEPSGAIDIDTETGSALVPDKEPCEVAHPSINKDNSVPCMTKDEADGNAQIDPSKPKKKGLLQFPKLGKAKAGDDADNGPGNSKPDSPASAPFGSIHNDTQEGLAAQADEESEPEGAERELIEGEAAGTDAESDPSKPKKKGLFQFPKFGKRKSDGNDIDASEGSPHHSGPVSDPENSSEGLNNNDDPISVDDPSHSVNKESQSLQPSQATKRPKGSPNHPESSTRGKESHAAEFPNQGSHDNPTCESGKPPEGKGGPEEQSPLEVERNAGAGEADDSTGGRVHTDADKPKKKGLFQFPKFGKQKAVPDVDDDAMRTSEPSGNAPSDVSPNRQNEEGPNRSSSSGNLDDAEPTKEPKSNASTERKQGKGVPSNDETKPLVTKKLPKKRPSSSLQRALAQQKDQKDGDATKQPPPTKSLSTQKHSGSPKGKPIEKPLRNPSQNKQNGKSPVGNNPSGKAGTNDPTAESNLKTSPKRKQPKDEPNRGEEKPTGTNASATKKQSTAPNSNQRAEPLHTAVGDKQKGEDPNSKSNGTPNNNGPTGSPRSKTSPKKNLPNGAPNSGKPQPPTTKTIPAENHPSVASSKPTENPTRGTLSGKQNDKDPDGSSSAVKAGGKEPTVKPNANSLPRSSKPDVEPSEPAGTKASPTKKPPNGNNSKPSQKPANSASPEKHTEEGPDSSNTSGKPSGSEPTAKPNPKTLPKTNNPDEEPNNSKPKPTGLKPSPTKNQPNGAHGKPSKKPVSKTSPDRQNEELPSGSSSTGTPGNNKPMAKPNTMFSPKSSQSDGDPSDGNPDPTGPKPSPIRNQPNAANNTPSEQHMPEAKPNTNSSAKSSKPDEDPNHGKNEPTGTMALPTKKQPGAANSKPKGKPVSKPSPEKQNEGGPDSSNPNGKPNDNEPAVQLDTKCIPKTSKQDVEPSTGNPQPTRNIMSPTKKQPNGPINKPSEEVVMKASPEKQNEEGPGSSHSSGKPSDSKPKAKPNTNASPTSSKADEDSSSGKPEPTRSGALPTKKQPSAANSKPNEKAVSKQSPQKQNEGGSESNNSIGKSDDSKPKPKSNGQSFPDSSKKNGEPSTGKPEPTGSKASPAKKQSKGNNSNPIENPVGSASPYKEDGEGSENRNSSGKAADNEPASEPNSKTLPKKVKPVREPNSRKQQHPPTKALPKKQPRGVDSKPSEKPLENVSPNKQNEQGPDSSNPAGKPGGNEEVADSSTPKEKPTDSEPLAEPKSKAKALPVTKQPSAANNNKPNEKPCSNNSPGRKNEEPNQGKPKPQGSNASPGPMQPSQDKSNVTEEPKDGERSPPLGHDDAAPVTTRPGSSNKEEPNNKTQPPSKAPAKKSQGQPAGDKPQRLGDTEAPGLDEDGDEDQPKNDRKTNPVKTSQQQPPGDEPGPSGNKQGKNRPKEASNDPAEPKQAVGNKSEPAASQQSPEDKSGKPPQQQQQQPPGEDAKPANKQSKNDGGADDDFLVFFDPITESIGKISRAKCIELGLIHVTKNANDKKEVIQEAAVKEKDKKTLLGILKPWIAKTLAGGGKKNKK